MRRSDRRSHRGNARVHRLAKFGGDEIVIESEHSSVILDGELFEAGPNQAIILKPTSPVPFLRLAA